MKIRALLLLVLLAAAGAVAARAQSVEVDMSVFFDSLSPYGNWVQTPDYGWVWQPRDIDQNWRPYTAGHWAYTEFGWTFVSDYDWGWAPFHYGRWYLDPAYGWRWVPGYEWAPAWVAWQEGGGWIGWAPLPPAAVWGGAELRFGGPNWGVTIDPAWFAFVETRHFLEPRVVTFVAPQVRNVTLVRQTVNITNYTIVNHTIVSRALPVEHVERVVGHPVPRLQVVSAASGARAHQQVQGNQLMLFKPAISHAKPAHVPTATVVKPRPVGQKPVAGAKSGEPTATTGATPHATTTKTVTPKTPTTKTVTPQTTSTVKPTSSPSPHPSPHPTSTSATGEPYAKPKSSPSPTTHPSPHVTSTAKPASSPSPHPSPHPTASTTGASPSPHPTPHASPSPSAAVHPATPAASAKPSPSATPKKEKPKPESTPPVG